MFMERLSLLDLERWNKKWKLEAFLENALQRYGLELPPLEVSQSNPKDERDKTFPSFYGCSYVTIPDPNPDLLKQLLPFKYRKEIYYTKEYAKYAFTGVTRWETIRFQLEDVVESRIGRVVNLFGSGREILQAYFIIKDKGEDLISLLEKERIPVVKQNQKGYLVKDKDVKEFIGVMVGYLKGKIEVKDKNYSYSSDSPSA